MKKGIKMEKLATLLTLLAVLTLLGINWCGCTEVGEDEELRCNGSVVEVLSEGVWDELDDCSQYKVEHSGEVCPRQCCDYGDGEFGCGFC